MNSDCGLLVLGGPWVLYKHMDGPFKVLPVPFGMASCLSGLLLRQLHEVAKIFGM